MAGIGHNSIQGSSRAKCLEFCAPLQVADLTRGLDAEDQSEESSSLLIRSDYVNSSYRYDSL